MRNIIIAIAIVLTAFTTNAQTKDKNKRVSFKVDGICGMCKKRIEKAALTTKGVKFAVWNVKTHDLSLIIDERKADVTTIQKNITKVGHDVFVTDKKKMTATKEAYESVHPCCKYRDDEIVENHKGELKKQKKQ